jgi:S1-C subfamily serine protease
VRRHSEVGEWVGAIGSPFGFEQSLVVGVVSALERAVPGDEFHTPFIQTDLPLNPGNSGGPLFDPAGSVVGTNTEVVVGDNGNAGISFAIPIDLAAQVATELMSAGHVNRAYLGVAFHDIDGPLAQAFGLQASGVVIHTVAPDSPAARAGLRVGDVVLALQGETIASGVEVGDVLLAVSNRPLLNESDLQEALNAASGSVPLLIDRNGTRMFIAVPVPATGHVPDHTATAVHANARARAPR